MKIYTSYFAVENKIPTGITRISIARWKPKGVVALEYKLLAPSESLLKKFKAGKIDVNGFAKEYYRDVLNKLSVEEVMRYFNLVSNGNDIVLLCFEKSDAFCHRLLVAEWLMQHGIEVEEYSIEKNK